MSDPIQSVSVAAETLPPAAESSSPSSEGPGAGASPSLPQGPTVSEAAGSTVDNPESASLVPQDNESAVTESVGCNRAHPRHDWRQTVQVCWLKGQHPEEPVTFHSVDLSAGGMCMETPGMVYLGRRGVAMLTDAKGRPIIRAFEARHCRYSSEAKCHIVGVKWIPADLNRLPIKVRTVSGMPQLTIASSAQNRRLTPSAPFQSTPFAPASGLEDASHEGVDRAAPDSKVA